jgi:polar amino acid transport system substrate-binding protein
MKKLTLLMLLGFGYSPLTASAELPKQLTLGGTDWCPYTCETGSDNPGIITEYLTWIFQHKGIQLNTRITSWTRAIQEANSGKTDGLLTAVAGETPELTSTTSPIMTYQDCFYTRTSDPWRYQGRISLEGRRLGVIQDYGYSPEIDEHIAQGIDVTTISGDDLQVRLHHMLAMGRIDTFIAEKRVYLNAINKHRRPLPAIRQSNCLAESPIFLAVQPERAWSNALLDFLDKELAKPESRRKLSEIEAVSLKTPQKPAD